MPASSLDDTWPNMRRMRRLSIQQRMNELVGMLK